MNDPLDQRLQLVISKRQVEAVDNWRRQQPDLPSRSAAIRRLIEAGLQLTDKLSARSPRGSGGDKPAQVEQVSDKPARRSPTRKAAPLSKEQQLRAMREAAAS